MDPTIAGTLSATKELTGLLGTIAKLKDKLLAKPSAAAEKLAFVLNEVGKTFEVVETELCRFLVLGGSPEALENAMKGSDNPLYELEGPKLRARIEQGRGHCHLIGNVYDKFLDKWLSKVLDPVEYQQIQDVFSKLELADYDLFQSLTSVSHYLEQRASATLDDARNGDWQAAHTRLTDARMELRELRSAIGGAIVQLYSLKNDFILASGSTVA